MRILGIDPAISSLGWGIITLSPSNISYIASGLIKTKPNELIYKRLCHIGKEIKEVLQIYNPDLIAMEETFINKNASTSLKLGYVRGTIMYLIGNFNKPYFEYTPNLIKKTVSGAGHAEKNQIKHMIKLIVSGTPELKNFDESDALAVAYTCSVFVKRPPFFLDT